MGRNLALEMLIFLLDMRFNAISSIQDNFAEIARRERLNSGALPLQTLRADIDFGRATAFTTYGTVGIKVWIYKGETFAKAQGKMENGKNKME